VAATAGGAGVTIVDFAFRSATTTVHAGDTVTWTNQGPHTHTATARDGSFDTGRLSKGASAGHRFSSPGTFTYACTIHPFMKGSIRVLASAAAPSGRTAAPTARAQAPAGSPAAQPAPDRAAPGGATSGEELPVTGGDPATVAEFGLSLVAAGLAGARLTRRRA